MKVVVDDRKFLQIPQKRSGYRGSERCSEAWRHVVRRTPYSERPVPFGIGLLMEVPWDLTNEQHHFRLELVDIADEASVKELIAFTLEEFGRLDALPDDFTHVFHATHYLGLDGAPWSDVKLHAAAL